MGLFKKMTQAVTGTDADDIKDGILATGLITGMHATSTSVSFGNYKYRMCDFSLEVHPKDGQPYNATSHQKILEWDMARIQPGSSTCAVRIDPNDPQRVAIDWQTDPPEQLGATAAPSADEHTTDEILASGEDCQLVIASFQDANMTHPRTGFPVYAFMFNVIPQTGDPYQVQVGLGVEARFLPKLFNGAQLPGKRIPGNVYDVVINWDAIPA